jgi:hypothetical protein
MAIPVPARSYFVGALELPEGIFAELLSDYRPDDPIWDFRPDPNRFTLREAICHVADWNDIFRERIERTRDEDHPLLPNMDEEQLAVDKKYAEADPTEALRRFAETRRTLIETVKALDPADWDRIANRARIGDITMSDQIALIAAHDAYHLRQVIEYRHKFAR